MLNKVKGNMYSFVTHTWNTIKGRCPHGCHYCYMKRFGDQPPHRFDEKELKTDLGTGNFIFLGSSCDMWADAIEADHILMTLNHCKKFDNQYLFQSKNPTGIILFANELPRRSTIATTMESNRFHPEMGFAPAIVRRAAGLSVLRHRRFRTMVTVEPVMAFDPLLFAEIILSAHPEQVNIGANTNTKCRLNEPTKEDVLELIGLLEDKTTVHPKPNLKRIIG